MLVVGRLRRTGLRRDLQHALDQARARPAGQAGARRSLSLGTTIEYRGEAEVGDEVGRARRRRALPLPAAPRPGGRRPRAAAASRAARRPGSMPAISCARRQPASSPYKQPLGAMVTAGTVIAEIVDPTADDPRAARTPIAHGRRRPLLLARRADKLRAAGRSPRQRSSGKSRCRAARAICWRRLRPSFVGAVGAPTSPQSPVIAPHCSDRTSNLPRRAQWVGRTRLSPSLRGTTAMTVIHSLDARCAGRASCSAPAMLGVAACNAQHAEQGPSREMSAAPQAAPAARAGAAGRDRRHGS